MTRVENNIFVARPEILASGQWTVLYVIHPLSLDAISRVANNRGFDPQEDGDRLKFLGLLNPNLSLPEANKLAIELNDAATEIAKEKGLL